MKICNKYLCAVVAALMLAALLSGCMCSHTWQESTCLAPRTCTKCGETEGKLRAHQWGSTACNDPQPCVVCGTMEGIELTHEWGASKICVHCGHDERPAEERFPEKLVEGLQQRWQLEAALLEDPEYVLTKEDWTALFDAEYDQLQSFKEAKFKDTALKEAALAYIKTLDESYEALEYAGTDRWTDKYDSRAYQQQTVALFKLNQLSPITVDEAYAENLSKMLVNGEIIDLVVPIVDQIFFLNIREDASGALYETTIENTSSLTFAWFSLDIDLCDEAGNVVESQSVRVEGWQPDQKRRLNFTTKAEFASIDIAFANWELLE